MDERSERGYEASEAFEQSAGLVSTGDSTKQTNDEIDDPVLRALRAAPWASISEKERAEIEELARNIRRTIPYDEFMASLIPPGEQLDDLED